MPQRAPTICTILACGALAVANGRCGAHPKLPWSGAGRGSTWAWRKLRAAVLEAADHRCQACDAPATEVDHIVPLAFGGTDDPGNLRALCRRCHNRATARAAAARGRRRRRGEV